MVKRSKHQKFLLEKPVTRTQSYRCQQICDFTGIPQWNQIPGGFSLEQAIATQNLVKQLPVNSKLVELGVLSGRSSVAIASVLPTNSKLHCIDHFKGSIEQRRTSADLSNLFELFMKNINNFGVQDKILVLPLSATAAAEKFEPESLDLIYLNADRDYDSVKEHLLQWYPKLKPSGFFLCDDYQPEYPGVMRAIKSVGLEGQLIAPALWCHRKLARRG